MSKTFVQKLFIGIWNHLTWNKVIMYMYCPCTYNSSWYHFVPITCMSVKGFSISYNVVNFFFQIQVFLHVYFFIKKQLVGCRSFDAWVDLFLNLFFVCLSNILKVSLLPVNVKNYLALDLYDLKSIGSSTSIYASSL